MKILEVVIDMVKKHISKSNAQRCKDYRQRLKAKLEKDIIEKILDNRVKSAKKEQKTEKKINVVDSMDFEGREPKEHLVSQYQHESKTQINLFGELEGEINPLDLVSHQKNLKNIFGNRSE